MPGKRNQPNTKRQSLSVIILSKLDEFIEAYTGPLDENEVDMLNSFFRRFGWPSVKRSRVNETLKRMENRGWISSPGPKIPIIISNKGKKYLKKIIEEQIALKPVKSWRGYYWLVIFDIPENKKLNRQTFRRHLKHLGLRQVQRSVWVYPGDCEKEVLALCQIYNVMPFVSLFKGVYIGDDRELRKEFGI